MSANGPTASAPLAGNVAPAQHGAPVLPGAPAAAISDRATPAPRIPNPNEPRPAQPAAAQPTAQPQTDQPHGYNFGDVAEHEVADFNSFGNYMHARGRPQEFVSDAIGWAREDAAQKAKIDDQIMSADLKEIQRIYGEEFNAADERVMSYVNSYPESTKIRLAFLAADKDGFKILDGWAKHAPVDMADPQPVAAKPEVPAA